MNGVPLIIGMLSREETEMLVNGDIIFNERRTILISDHNRMGDPNDYDR